MIGAVAALCTTLCWLPQTIRVIRLRDTSSLSLATFSIFVIGIVLWLAYGIMIVSWPLILANVFTLALNGTILALKLRYG
ncbi:SemiSWEET transporter [Hyphomicrobiaceae bacterium 22]|uniref:SemiSWEET transporter n=1 Tax=Prosthecodimorpha staleyi TaxID=2840188 RepID=A0A947GCG4_9HYPH|nr:SemiSWEET transporter [Prosthecodimorpha staleyi]